LKTNQEIFLLDKNVTEFTAPKGFSLRSLRALVSEVNGRENNQCFYATCPFVFATFQNFYAPVAFEAFSSLWRFKMQQSSPLQPSNKLK